MNGMVTDSWPYVIAAYGVTWAVLLGYSFRLIAMTRRNSSINNSVSTSSRSGQESQP
jgi:CcmD family protein